MNLILCGHHGCGKTTIAKQYAAQFEFDLIDIDQLLCEKFSTDSIRALFQELGEERFRIAEHQLIVDLIPETPTIISTGGGSMLNQQTVHHLKTLGKIIFIAEDQQVLLKRILAQPTLPAFLNPDKVEQHFAEYFQHRAAIYQSVADFIIESVDKTIDNLVLDLNDYRYSYGE